MWDRDLWSWERALLIVVSAQPFNKLSGTHFGRRGSIVSISIIFSIGIAMRTLLCLGHMGYCSCLDILLHVRIIILDPRRFAWELDLGRTRDCKR